MSRRLTICLAAGWLGCAATDPCSDQNGKSCIALEVDGDGISVDQLRVDASGLVLAGALTPSQPRAQPVELPIFVAVLPGDFVGGFTLSVQGLQHGAVIADGSRGGSIDAGQHTRVTVTLHARGGLDLAQPLVDIAGADLADVACNVITQAPCLAGQKCVISGSGGLCRSDGSATRGQTCGLAPDNCVRGLQCVSGVCLEGCLADKDCTQPAAAVAGTSEPMNGPHCFVAFSPAPANVKACSIACDPVSATSGCPVSEVCFYTGDTMVAPEYTFCSTPGGNGEAMPCAFVGDCAGGLSCVGGASGARCRRVCRAATNSDCPTAGTQCKAGAAGAGGMFGYCCPAAGC